ncbi:MAG: hypothetical protein PWP46_492 [Fusobacteriaceae bacterium]|jgi:uncharacterized protein (TIGR02677 family)|nr:hypothetical protein [Fusobacteriales bacterium]MDN5303613.1 hypothetical protein [Fusobacteriaceae bacterium]
MLEKELFKTYEEFSYLNTQRSLYYRTIIRYMYNELQKKEFLYRYDIYNYMKTYKEFNEYTEEECYKDLDFLCEKGNIIKYKNDYSTIKSIEEIKKKKFRYQLTEKTRMIEDMLINRFNKINAITVVLDRNLLKNFKQELIKFLDRKEEFLELSNKEIYSWWGSLVRAFEELRRNYKEYIQDVNSFEYEKLIDSKEFLLKKNKLKEYLEEFISGLMEESGEIKKILIELNNTKEFEELLERIIEHEYEINSMTKDIKRDIARQKVLDMREKINNWFVGENDENEVEILRKNTINIINKIIKVAKKIISKRMVNYSRRESYKQVAKMFLTCKNIEEAHKFAGIIFGINEVKHFQGVLNDDEDINDNLMKDNLIINVKKISKNRLAKKNIYFQDKTIEKINYMRQKEEEKEKQKIEIEKYIFNNILEIEKLPKINSYLKNILIEYIKKGLTKPPKQSEQIIVLNNKMYRKYNKVEVNNQIFNLLVPIDEKDRCVVKTEDGNLEMPTFIIKFGE